MVDRSVIVSPNIQLSRCYDLVGIIHYEGSLNSGHYYAHKKTSFGFLEINDGLVNVTTSMTRSIPAYIVFYQQQAEILNNESEPKDVLFSNNGHANPYTDNNKPERFPNAEMPLLDIAGNKKIGKQILENRHMSSSFEKFRPEELEMDEESKTCWSLNITLHDNEVVEDELTTVSTTKKQVEERQSRLLIQKQDYIVAQGDGETEFENYKQCIVFMCFSSFKV